MLTLAPVNFHPNWQCRRLDASLQLGIGFIYERLIAIMLPPTAVLAHHGIYESILATSPPPLILTMPLEAHSVTGVFLASLQRACALVHCLNIMPVFSPSHPDLGVG